MRKIFLDLDGVFADFHKFVRDNCGIEYVDDPKVVWSTLQNIPHLFSELELIDGSLKMFHDIVRTAKIFGGCNDYQIEFLTALPQRTGKLMTAARDKADWVDINLTEVHHVNVVDHWSKKKYYCQLSDILIDDAKRNCDEWESVGGIAIHHVSQRETVEQLRMLLEPQ